MDYYAILLGMLDPNVTSGLHDVGLGTAGTHASALHAVLHPEKLLATRYRGGQLVIARATEAPYAVQILAEVRDGRGPRVELCTQATTTLPAQWQWDVGMAIDRGPKYKGPLHRRWIRGHAEDWWTACEDPDLLLTMAACAGVERRFLIGALCDLVLQVGGDISQERDFLEAIRTLGADRIAPAAKLELARWRASVERDELPMSAPQERRVARGEALRIYDLSLGIDAMSPVDLAVATRDVNLSVRLATANRFSGSVTLANRAMVRTLKASVPLEEVMLAMKTYRTRRDA